MSLSKESLKGTIQCHRVTETRSQIMTKMWCKLSMITLREEVRFSGRLKTASDELWRIASGRLFHARGPATTKARSPNVERRGDRSVGLRSAGIWMQLAQMFIMRVSTAEKVLKFLGSKVKVRQGQPWKSWKLDGSWTAKWIWTKTYKKYLLYLGDEHG